MSVLLTTGFSQQRLPPALPTLLHVALTVFTEPLLPCCAPFPHPRLSVAEVLPLAQGILQGLFTAFQQPDSAENEYLMRAVMRLISFLGPQIAPVAPMCLQVG